MENEKVESNHEFWLRDAWRMIRECASGVEGNCVVLTKEGCAALLEDRRDAERYRRGEER